MDKNKKDVIEQLTPGELLAATVRRKPVVDTSKLFEDMSPGELFVLQSEGYVSEIIVEHVPKNIRERTNK